MSRTDVKICGINSPEALSAAQRAGADYLGFVFFAKSPRAVTPEQAASLCAQVQPGVLKVGLLVDADDDTIREILRLVPLDILQLHGGESLARVAQIRQNFGLPVMKVVKVSDAEDLEAAVPFEEVADHLLFDAKPPKTMKGALPGGNALAFDWRLLAGRSWRRPWMLAGGLHADNVGEAVRISGAPAVDVSSGVEDSPGVKSAAKIEAFIRAVKEL